MRNSFLLSDIQCFFSSQQADSVSGKLRSSQLSVFQAAKEQARKVSLYMGIRPFFMHFKFLSQACEVIAFCACAYVYLNIIKWLLVLYCAVFSCSSEASSVSNLWAIFFIVRAPYLFIGVLSASSHPLTHCSIRISWKRAKATGSLTRVEGRLTTHSQMYRVPCWTLARWLCLSLWGNSLLSLLLTVAFGYRATAQLLGLGGKKRAWLELGYEWVQFVFRLRNEMMEPHLMFCIYIHLIVVKFYNQL